MLMNIKTLNLDLPNKETIPIYIGFNCIKECLSKCNLERKRVFIITQQKLLSPYVNTVKSYLNSSLQSECEIITVEETEEAKSFKSFETCLNKIFSIGVERQDVIIGFGGGVVTDLAGFIASSCLRGLTLIQIPTTLLAQVDAAIGGKTGINHKTGKNLIGSFYQPSHIIMDLSTLKTLPKDEFKSGFGEVLKYAFICDEKLFSILKHNATTLKYFDLNLNHELFKDIIARSCQNKIDVVQADEKESNLRAILNFGHTIGHAIEALFEYTVYKHGICVVFGMCAATFIAYKKHLISKEIADDIFSLIKLFDYHHIKLLDVDKPKAIEIIKRDKKVKQQVIRFILPIESNQVKIFDNVSVEEIYDSIDFIKDFFKGE